MAKGEIPIAKNIIVVDEQGREYGATWLKRAKGLVKNGRARFLSENRICLACPPEIDLEDKEMSDRDNWKEELSGEILRRDEAENDSVKEEASIHELLEKAEKEGLNEGLPKEEPRHKEEAKRPMDAEGAKLPVDAEGQTDVLAYILKQMEAVQRQTEYLNKVIDGLSMMNSSDVGEFEDTEDVAEEVLSFLSKKVNALTEIVRCRETTNQELLRMYGRMYEDTPMKAASRQKAYSLVECVVNSHQIGSEDKKDIIINLIRYVPEAAYSK